MYMEEVFLTDLIYEDFDAARKIRGYTLHLEGDKRKKPDKRLRIKSTLGVFKRKKFIIDERLEDDPDWITCKRQYLKFTVTGKYKCDGPDAIEGGLFLLNQMIREDVPPLTGQPRRNSRL